MTDTNLVSRNVSILGRRTSIRLEPEMWSSLNEISRLERCTIHQICSLVFMRKHAGSTLTSAVRVFLMLYYRAATTTEGHKNAGHGQLRAKYEAAEAALNKEQFWEQRRLEA